MANCEYGNFNPQMSAAAVDDRWRLPSAGSGAVNGNTCLPQQLLDVSNGNDAAVCTTIIDADAADAGKTAVTRVESNDSRDVHPVPSEWAKFWVLVGRCHVHYYRDWVGGL